MIIAHHVYFFAFAYIDPGSGVLILQVAGAAVVGAWFSFRRHLTNLLRRAIGSPALVNQAQLDATVLGPQSITGENDGSSNR